jgi:hypothetical protein
MVGIIPLNLRSQETYKGVPRARVAVAVGRAGLGPGVARRGRQAGMRRAGEHGMVVVIFSTH